MLIDWFSRSGMSWCCLFACVVLQAVLAAAADNDVPKVQRLTKTYYPKFFLQYSPDGSHIAFCRHHRNLRGTNQVLVALRIMKSDGSGDRPLLAEFDAAVQIQEHPAFSPDGKKLLISGGGNDTGNSSKDTFVCDLDAEFNATKLRKVVARNGVQLGEEPKFSPDGKQIAFVSVDETLWASDADGMNKERVVQVDGSYCHQPVWSPDGQWIAFATDRDGDVELYKVRWDGSELTRLTKSKGFDCRPQWSRDGRWILFTSNRNGNHDLFLMTEDGFDVRRLTSHSAMDDHGALSPDGRTVSFVSMRDGGFDIYRLSLPADIRIGPAPEVVPRTTEGAGGLLAHYSFEGASGDATTVRDEAGRNHLQLMGAKIHTEEGRRSLLFDQEGDHATAGNGVMLRKAGPLTISFWVNPAKLGGNGYLLSKYGWNIYISSDGRPRFETRTAGNKAWDTLAAADALPVAQWTMVTAVFDVAQKRASVYINGKLSAERARADGALGATNAYPLLFGLYTVSKTQQFQGRLDEIRIHGRALTADEVAASYTVQAQIVR